MLYITGDTHGEFQWLEEIARNPDAEYIIVCGDFGFLWDGNEADERLLDSLDALGPHILFVDGNHENFDLLKMYPAVEWNGGKIHHLRDKVTHLMRGQIFTLCGHKVFTMGGARSNDISDGIVDPNTPYALKKIRKLEQLGAHFRIKHYSWWPEELPSDIELDEAVENLTKHNKQVDIILTHCAPDSIQTAIGKSGMIPNRLTAFLEAVKDCIDYSLWFFGHYHRDQAIDDKHILLYHGHVKLESKNTASA